MRKVFLGNFYEGFCLECRFGHVGCLWRSLGRDWCVVGNTFMDIKLLGTPMGPLVLIGISGLTLKHRGLLGVPGTNLKMELEKSTVRKIDIFHDFQSLNLHFFFIFFSPRSPFSRLQICPPKTFSETKPQMVPMDPKYWFPGFGFDSGPNLQP